MLLFKDAFKRKMVGFDDRSVLSDSCFEKEKKVFFLIFMLTFILKTSEVTGSKRENRKPFDRTGRCLFPRKRCPDVNSRDIT